MLEQVLDLLKDGKLHSLKEIADKMNVSLPLLEKMIEELVRLSYLKALPAICDENCKECGLKETCSIGCTQGIWTLTEKGKDFLQRRNST